MRIRKILMSLVLISCLPGLNQLLAEEIIGEIAYLEDEIEITRNSITLDYVDIGTTIENFDLLTTGEYGLAEIALSTEGSPDTTIKVSPNTAFYFELDQLKQGNKTTLGMISGSVSMKVRKMSRSQAFEIRTESATMGVRDTSFTITTTVTGDLLITCDEGRVSCRDEEDSELFAVPGKAVEKRSGEIFRAIPVAVSDLRTFQNNWYAERLSVFKSNALKVLRGYAVRYLTLVENFNQAYNRLYRNKEIISKWFRQESSGTMGSTMENMREKKKLIGDLLRLRRVLFIFERVYFRLQELKSYYDQGYGRGTIKAGLTADAFFRRFERDKDELSRKMARIRYITKLYSIRNNGSFPTDAFSTDESGDSFLNSDFSF